MKKMIIVIFLLFIIFVSLVIYRNSEKESEIKIDEVKSIENYLSKIYGWKEITNEALPIFDNINNADEKWLWGILRDNIEENEIDYDTINEQIKRIFGKKMNKEYPKQGTEFIEYDEENNKYKIAEIRLDSIKDSFMINKIEKNKNSYIVEIIEYLVDYTDTENGKIFVKNLNNEQIYQLTEEEATEGNIQKIIKENIGKFTKKKVTLEKEDEEILITKVESVKEEEK